MQIPTLARDHLRWLGVLTTFVLVFAPLAAAANSSLPAQMPAEQHRWSTTTPLYSALNENWRFWRAGNANSPHDRSMPAMSVVVDSSEISVSQTVTTTETITPTRGGGLVLPKLTLPKRDNDSSNDESTENDESTDTGEETVPEDNANTSDIEPSEAIDETAEEEQATAPTSEEAAPSADTDNETDEEAGAVGTLADVRSAVVQIEAVGTFVDPAEGMQLNAAGRGSGFIIDPSGIAVTNNHVVTGGGLYKVYIDGEDEPRNAKVLGVSECADLAVIDIQGDGFPYLDWYEGRIRVGLDVYAVGFPLGDPEFTMTRGIVAKERADGDTNWASVDRVIQHDASINPGNSGGPLVNADGQVVAVNYAGNSNTNQYFAISRDQAIDVIEQLRTGVNVDSIGINGEAINNGEGLSGHWVASVKSGSPADRAGIKGGDIILKMEGLVLSEDGSMATYCDILQSHDSEDVLSVQVLRFATEEVLEGQINGRELTTSFSIAEEVNGKGDTTGTSGSGEEGAAPTYDGYTTITDRTGIISMDVPTDWAETTSDDWIWNDETVGIRLLAAADLEKMLANWGYPGVIFNVSTSLVANYTPDDLLDNWQYTSSCTYEGRKEIPEGYFTGAYDLWTECKGDENGGVIVALVPEEENFILLIEIYLAGAIDFDAVDHILDSFVIKLDNTATPTGSAVAPASGSLFDLVDLSGLTYDYTIVNEAAVTALAPAGWTDISSDDLYDDNDQLIGKQTLISTDIEAYNSNWETPGIYVRTRTDLSEAIDIDAALEWPALQETCTYDDRYEYENVIYGITYQGAYDLYYDCDGTDNAFVYLIVQSESYEQTMFIEFLALDEADWEALSVFFQSFYLGEVTESAGGSEESTAEEFMVINDDSETLVVRVPTAWTDISSGDWELDGRVVGLRLEASPDLDSYNDSWTTPGLFFGASPEFSGSAPADILDILDFSDDCTRSDRFEYDDSVFSGHYDLWEACGDTETHIVFLAASPKENPDYLVLLGVQMPSADDFTTLDEIFKSFNLNLAPDGIGNVTPTAQVVVNALNVRSGPGTNYSRIGGVSRGETLVVIGEYNNCSWLNVQTRGELTGWISGSSQYVNFTANCAEIPAVEPPPPPQSTGARSGGGSVGNQGCYLFQNGIGPELTITYTRRGDGWNVTFKVPPDGEYRQCFPPGDYTYTLDAPPPWGSTNGEMTVSAGDNFLFPITPGE